MCKEKLVRKNCFVAVPLGSWEPNGCPESYDRTGISYFASAD